MTDEDDARIAAHPLAAEVRQAVRLLDTLAEEGVETAHLHRVGERGGYIHLDASRGSRYCSWDLDDDDRRPGAEAGDFSSESPYRHQRKMVLDDGTRVYVCWEGQIDPEVTE